MKVNRTPLVVLFSVIGLLLLSGCATMSPLTQQEKARIRTIGLSSSLGNELKYVRLGTTVFQNHNDSVPDDELLSGLVDGVRKGLLSRGYTVVEADAVADYVLLVEGGTTYNYPSGRGVNGAGFFVHSVLGMNPGIEAQALIFFRLKDPKTGKVRSSVSVNRMRLTPIKKAPPKWSELTEEDQRALIEALTEELDTVPEEGVRKLGL